MKRIMRTESSSPPPERDTKKACGSPSEQDPRPLITQAAWRKAGVAAVCGASLMAWLGIDSPFVRQSVWHFLLFWGACLGLLAVALYTVVLDIRYIRLQYAIGRRVAFQQTLGSEEFRKELLAVQRKPSGGNGRRR